MENSKEGLDPRQPYVGPHKINKLLLLCRKEMIYFINNGCYWITSAIDKNYSNIFVLSVYKIKKGRDSFHLKKFDWNSIGYVCLNNSICILTF